MKQPLPLNELFVTIQGEARYTGTPATFLRLQGCAVGCPWCDTKHTWAMDTADLVDLTSVLAKRSDSRSYAMATVGQLLEQCLKGPEHVVITGGEPCDHDLLALTACLMDAGLNVQIETSGTAPVRVDERAWVTLSPKIAMPGGKTLLPDAWARADEIKMPVGKASDIETLKRLIEEGGISPVPLIWLQPLSANPKATQLCMMEAIANGWHLSLQTHKFIGAR